MALRGKKPKDIEKRLKVLLYGAAGVGKTTAAIQFPRPYLVDTERGAENPEYVKRLEKSGGAYWHTTSPDELIAEVMQLISSKHPYKTLAIDPLTVIYNELLDKGIEEAGGTDFGRHKIGPDRIIKHLTTLLFRLDMNVIITSHAKPLWIRSRDARGKETAVQEGMTYDCYGRLDYMFDLVIEIAKRGNERVGIVKKTRLAGFPEGEVFPFSYDEIARRYGRDILERDCVPVELASVEQVREIEALLSERTNGKDLADKWLKKADADNFSEMSAEAIVKCIAHLKGNPQPAEAN